MLERLKKLLEAFQKHGKTPSKNLSREPNIQVEAVGAMGEVKQLPTPRTEPASKSKDSRPAKVHHIDQSKFFEGKSRHALWYRKSIKEQKKPEEDEE